VGEVREVENGVPQIVSKMGVAADGVLTINGCHKLFAGWMARFGQLMYFCGPPT